jgi:hypothetical protein
MQFTVIEGTAVPVKVGSAKEAKAALKELKHKKRELKFLRSALLRRRAAAQAGQKKPKRARSWLWRLFSGTRWLIAALIDFATVPRAERRARSLAEVERELGRIDETLHNIQGCILQLEGRLLTFG